MLQFRVEQRKNTNTLGILFARLFLAPYGGVFLLRAIVCQPSELLSSHRLRSPLTSPSCPLEPSLKATWEHEYKYSALPVTACVWPALAARFFEAENSLADRYALLAS